jgi:membrane protein YqaA with SNARE-associated domain
MRGWLAIAAGLALGVGVAWWLGREAPQDTARKQQRARQAAAVQARDARPALYRWRDEAGVLQITDAPPTGRPFERIERDAPAAITVNGEPRE